MTRFHGEFVIYKVGFKDLYMMYNMGQHSLGWCMRMNIYNYVIYYIYVNRQ